MASSESTTRWPTSGQSSKRPNEPFEEPVLVQQTANAASTGSF
jgi:hypothetical protein